MYRRTWDWDIYLQAGRGQVESKDSKQVHPVCPQTFRNRKNDQYAAKAYTPHDRYSGTHMSAVRCMV